MRLNPILDLYPETAAGGFARNHPRGDFFARIRAILPRDAAVLDFGAGRGMFAELDSPGLRALTDLKPVVARLAAFDVDPVVLENCETDDRHYAPIGAPLPFADASFDVVFSTWVAEHIADPEFYCAEIARILKPGGWFCALTPNRRGAIALGARLVPNRLHVAALKRLAPWRAVHDTFPTCYRLNTRGDVARHFPGWTNASYYFNGPPPYHMGRRSVVRAWQLIDRVLPNTMARLFAIFVRKPGA